MPSPHRQRPGRRALVAGLLGAGATGLAGCRVRLEDDAPALPLVAARTPVPAEDLLTALTRDCAGLAATSGQGADAVTRSLADVHRRQHTVLRAALLRAQVAAHALEDPASTPTPGPVTATSLGAAEARAAEGVARFAGVGAELRASIASLHAQRFAAALLLTGAPPALAEVTTSLAKADAVADSLAGAGYLLEVVAARSSGTLRSRARSTGRVLAALRDEVLRAGAASPGPLGRPLPFPVRDLEDAGRLGTTTMRALRADVGRSLGPLLAEDPAHGLVAATRWLGTLEHQAHRWGLALEPFPGLT